MIPRPISNTSQISLGSLQTRKRSQEIAEIFSQTVRDFEGLIDDAILLARQAIGLNDDPFARANNKPPGLLTERSNLEPVPRDNNPQTTRDGIVTARQVPLSSSPVEPEGDRQRIPTRRNTVASHYDQGSNTSAAPLMVDKDWSSLNEQRMSNKPSQRSQRTGRRSVRLSTSRTDDNHAAARYGRGLATITHRPSVTESVAEDCAYPRTCKPTIKEYSSHHIESGLGKFQIPEMPPVATVPTREQQEHIRRRQSSQRQSTKPSKAEVKEYINAQNRAISEAQTRPNPPRNYRSDHKTRRQERRAWREAGVGGLGGRRSPSSPQIYELSSVSSSEDFSIDSRFVAGRMAEDESSREGLDLRNTRHVDLQGGASTYPGYVSHRHQPVARDWHNHRKRYAATVACINTALLGIIVGIYAGEVPAIQYAIADLHHYAILGNVFLYIGLVIPTLVFWPLPLLHGRKAYTLGALAVTLPLQIPQGIAVGAFRSPYQHSYRILLLLCRGLSGFALGFAAINFKTTLLDLFGASLMSANPHQEVVDDHDIRRHGGGMGLWLGWWSWCTMGSISIGFFVGAAIIDTVNLTWGFWVSIFCIMTVMFLNVVTPEVRRSAYRRTTADMAEFGTKGGGRYGKTMKRVARGEIKMHLRKRGPLWWGEEVKAGIQLSLMMVRQPGFFVLMWYLAWVQAQFSLVLMVSCPRIFFRRLGYAADQRMHFSCWVL